MGRERKERVHGPYDRGTGAKRWRVVVIAADGSQTTQSFATEAEGRSVADAARTQIKGRSLMHALDEYETDLRSRELAGATIQRVRAHLDRLLVTAQNGPRQLTWLTPGRAAALYAQLRISPARGGKTLAVDTHRNAVKVCRQFGRWCAAQGWLPRDPFARVDGVGKRHKGKPQLTVDELRKLLDACFAERSRASIAVATSALLGAGASEVVDRQVRDLDDRGRILHVTKGKNRFRVRTLELPMDLRAALLELAKDRRGAAWLFGDGDLDKPSRYWIYWHTKRLCKAAKVPEVAPHGLRGTHATIALGAVSTSHYVAAALAAAGASLGHAPGSPITASTYAAPGSVDKATQRAAMRVLRGGAGR